MPEFYTLLLSLFFTHDSQFQRWFFAISKGFTCRNSCSDQHVWLFGSLGKLRSDWQALVLMMHEAGCCRLPMGATCPSFIVLMVGPHYNEVEWNREFHSTMDLSFSMDLSWPGRTLLAARCHRLIKSTVINSSSSATVWVLPLGSRYLHTQTAGCWISCFFLYTLTIIIEYIFFAFVFICVYFIY